MSDLADRLEARLLAARDRVERIFLDECLITRDPSGLDDDVLDTDTGLLTPPDSDDGAVYAGRCAFQAQNRVLADPATDASQHAAQPVDPHYTWRGPIADVPELRMGDTVTCTSSRLDEQLVDRRFRISERPSTDTFGVLRVCELEAL